MSVLAAVIPAVSGLLSEIFDGLSTDNKTKAEQAMKLLDMAAAETAGQQDINKTEAAHRSLFVAGWRPFIGWVCGASLLYAFLLQPLLVWLLSLFCPDWGGSLPAFPMEFLLELMFGMLGIGTLRTFEKVKGVSR